jgi:hypothetical protein
MDIEITRQSAMLETMTIEELRQLNREVVETINHKRKMASLQMRNSLNVGDLVEADHPTLLWKQFEVMKIKRTKADIRAVDSNSYYTVPMSILSPVVTS